MSGKRWLLTSVIGAAVGWCATAHAGDLKITLPKRSEETPVQRLNREGVREVRKHEYDKAEILFYKAYLLDPDDPFTLNNLGYISELKGQLDRAQGFYTLASQEASDAVIDDASSPRVKGYPMKEALSTPGLQLHIDHDNVEAVHLLSHGRAAEADLLLRQALKGNTQNVFTLNNLGVAKEMEGESQEALGYYDKAAKTGSNAAAVVTVSQRWRDKPVNEIAAENARSLRARLETENSKEARLTELSLRGVSAVNRNDLQSAVKDFREAYALDPGNPFALNNIGYVSEVEGDRETAHFFYEAAEAAGAQVTVGLATTGSAQGLKLFQVASDNGAKVQAQLLQERDLRRRQHESVLLRRRDNSVVKEPTPASLLSQPSASSP